jgi:F0F1-type ATP synthase epsilon subunit
VADVKTLHLRVQSPAATLLDSDVYWVDAQLADGGWIGIWPGHGALLAETIDAPMYYADEQGEHELDLQAGILEVSRHETLILTSGLIDDPRRIERQQQPEEPPRLGRLAQALVAALDKDVERSGREEA